jgi:hypothetical protein
MPAKWPSFINKVATKLDSRSTESIPEFGEFLADEYVNAVDTAQTPFGNTHSGTGQKQVLVEGFKKSFKKLYENYNTSLEDRKTISRYSDMVEGLPNADLTFDVGCEIEKWSLENTDTLKKFTFYPLYESTCPIPYPIEDVESGDSIDFNIISDASNDINSTSHNYIVKFLISKYDTNQSYKVRYSLNGVEQGLLTVGNDGFTTIKIPQTKGTYSYNFIEILNSSGENAIRIVNKSKSITIGDGGVLEKLSDIDDLLQGENSEYPGVIKKEPRNTIPTMTEEEQINALAMRVLSQNDGTELFKLWVYRLGNYGPFPNIGLKVENIIKGLENEWRSKEITKTPASKKRSKKDIIPPIETEDNINQYIFQEEHIDRVDSIPDDITADFICKFTYIKEYDGSIKSNSISRAPAMKLELYKKEKSRWFETQIKWARSKEEEFKQDQEDDGTDPYEIMASAVISYWQSTAVQPFKNTPPVPPCNTNIPLGGTYAPIYYGSKSMLANDLRKAWNNGKFFDVQPANPVASKLVASAVATSFSKHLALLKFLYLGGITTPVGPVPMIGFVPAVF